MEAINEATLRAMFQLAGLPITKVWQLAHAYFTYSEGEDEKTTKDNALYRAQRPSWLVRTPYGLIELTLRKRVVIIDWSETGASIAVTTDETTKGPDHVHAWTTTKAVEYLARIRESLHNLEAHKRHPNGNLVTT